MNAIALLTSRSLLSFVCHAALYAAVSAACFGQEVADAKAPFFRVETGLDRLPLKGVSASIEIVGTLAQVELVQTYANVGSEPIEATYVFPGSTRSAVNALEMRVGDRVVRAVIEEKAKARQTYEVATRQGKTASLLEQHRPNVFQMNLSNLLPGDVVEVTLRYTEWLEREKDEYCFVLPLVVGPRYGRGVGDWIENPHLGRSEANSVVYEIAARARSAVKLERMVCASHEAEVVFDDSRAATVRLEGDAESVGNRDFELRYRVSGDEVKSGLLVSESNGEKYFMATMEPPKEIGPRKRMPREYFFIVDVSGSMSGFPLDTAKEMMGALVACLDEEDRFNLMLFAGESSVFAPAPVAATEENLLKAVRFLLQRHGGGGTELLPALLRAYETPREQAFSRSIVILTDGYVSVEEEVFELVRQRLNEANVFACGIGSSPNRLLIEGMARVGQGEPFFVTDPRESKDVANRFSEYVSAAVLSRIEVRFEGVEVYDVEPVRLPDLLAERPLVVFGKFKGATSGKIELSGLSGKSKYRSDLDFASAVDLGNSRALEYVWARERIRRVSDYARFWPDEERVREVTDLGLKHSLLTRYTSFVAVDEVIRNLDAGKLKEMRQPLPLPQGMDQGIGGSSVPVTPEPEMWALLGCVFVAVSWILFRRAAY